MPIAFQINAFTSAFLTDGSPGVSGAAFQSDAFTSAFQTGSVVTPSNFSFTTTQPGALADYTSYLKDGVTKLDRDGDPVVLSFTLEPHAGFVKLNRGAYITLDSAVYPNWFTGYITNDPALSYIGSSNGTMVYGYAYQATDDSYILSLKSIGLLPPFVSKTAGEILRFIVSVLDTRSLFDVSGIEDGPLLARYIVDPNKKFVDVVRELTKLCHCRFAAKDHVLTFEPKDTTPATIVINGASSNPHFSPARLNVRPTNDPIINDGIVVGAPEPQNFVTEYFAADGFTAHFPLLSGLYGGDSADLLTDDMSGSQLNTQSWTVYDSNAKFQLFNGYLNILGGNGDESYDVHLDSVSLFPLEATLRITHGLWDFVSTGAQPNAGLIAGLWTQAPNSSLTGCIYGLNVSKVSSDLKISPIVNGVVDSSQVFTVDLTKRYVIRTVYNFSRAVRQNSSFSYIDQAGDRGVYGGDAVSDTATYSTWLVELDPVTGLTTSTAQFINAGVNITADHAYANYVLAASNDLHATVMGVNVSVPMHGALAIKESGASVFTPQILGVNEIDSLDGLAPVATVVSNGGGSNRQTVGLGTPSFNPGDATLTFFKDTTRQISYIPQPGDIVRLAYRRAGVSAGRVQNASSIALESSSWGDDGIRSVTKSDLNPLPRTSVECELAAAALVQEMGFQHYDGDYTQYSLFEFTDEPISGTILTFENLPASFSSDLQGESISEVSSVLNLQNPVEYFTHRVSFGKSSNLSKALGKLYRAQDQVAAGINLDAADMPTATQLASIGLVTLPDVASPSVTAFNPTDFTVNSNETLATGTALEVRLTDDSWGVDDVKNLLTRSTSATFSLPRDKRNKVCYIKLHDSRNKLYSSEDFSNAVWTKTSATVTNATGVNPVDKNSQLSTVVFSGGGKVTQDPKSITGGGSINIDSTTATFSVSIKGTVGQDIKVAIANNSNTIQASTVVTTTGYWQRVSVSYTGTAGQSGTFRAVVTPDSGTPTILVTNASFELAAAETGYFKTSATLLYGASSRFASAVRVNFPFVPDQPTTTFDADDMLNILVTAELPVDPQDVFGLEIRDTDDATVLYSYEDLTLRINPDGPVLTYKWDNPSRLTSKTLYAYFYNIAKEYSARTTISIVTTTPSDPTSLALTSGSSTALTRGDGIRISRIKAAWTASVTNFDGVNGFVDVEYKTNAGSTWLHAASLIGDQTQAYITGIDDGVAYDVRIRSRNANGGVSAWVSVTNHTVATIVHGGLSYSPTTNPLTGTDAGATATISIVSFTMRVAGVGDVSYNSGSVTALSFSTLYYIYIDDPTLVGGAVTYHATTSKDSALGTASGRLLVGSILTPQDGAPDTIGNNDGGVGAQMGYTFAFIFGNTETQLLGNGAVTNEADAIDGSWSTKATVSTTGDTGTNQAFLNLFNPPGIAIPNNKTITLYVKRTVTNSLNGTGTVGHISLINRATNTLVQDLETFAPGVGAATGVISLVVTPTMIAFLSNGQIQLGAFSTISSSQSSGSIAIDIYGAWYTVN